MFEIHVEVDDKQETEYTFKHDKEIKKFIAIDRDPDTKKFPTIEAFFKVKRPEYKTPYNGFIGVGKKIREFVDFEYNEKDSNVYYTGVKEFDVNEYKCSEKKNKIKVQIYLK